MGPTIASVQFLAKKAAKARGQSVQSGAKRMQKLILLVSVVSVVSVWPEVSAISAVAQTGMACQPGDRESNGTLSSASGTGGMVLMQLRRGATQLSIPLLLEDGLQWISHAGGNCLKASADSDSASLSVEVCKTDDLNQQWAYDDYTGLVALQAGHKCLDASQRSVIGGQVHVWECDPSNANQIWDVEASTGQVKNRFGICLDSPAPLAPGSGVHMWSCDASNFNQRWFLTDPGAEPQVTSTTTATSTTTGLSTSTTVDRSGRRRSHRRRRRRPQRPETSTTTSTSTTSTTTATATRTTTTTSTTVEEQPLSAVRNCYLEPLESGAGCEQLEVFKNEAEFGLNQFGQETSGRQACLRRLRDNPKGDSFVHAPGTCEIWQCLTLSSLRDSAGNARLFVGNKRSVVFSQLCDYQPSMGGLRGQEIRSPIFVKLWEWNFDDIARECEEYLGPNGVDAVQISPVIEHVVGHQWWTKYQPVSMGLGSRSGSEEQFRGMVSRCRAVGVEVIVDVLLNHIASPCAEAKGTLEGTPCVGWAGSKYGNRRVQGACGWDQADPEMFHHRKGNASQGVCSVGPWTAWLCPENDCTPCEMYGMPDWDTGQSKVRDMHARHLEELFSLGVTMIRLDAAIYHHVADLASMLNRIPWDLVYQEWWGEYPPADRTDFVGHYRDVNYRWQIVDIMAVKDVANFSDLLNLNGGVFGISQEMAVYPFAYHDGRSEEANPTTATYKNGLEFHQQQKFFLAWPHGIAMLVWGGYGWTDKDQGPPGCDAASGDRCVVQGVFDAESGSPRCMSTPSKSPLPEGDASERGWVCEHRWQGVAGMIHFRKACRGMDLAQTWSTPAENATQGHLAFRLAGEDGNEACFVALVRGYNEVSKPSWGHLGDWSLEGLSIGLPAGRYCDLASLHTQRGWDRRSCPREVEVGAAGVVVSGQVPEGDLLAIHTGARLLDKGSIA